jgi:hypothetical protein
MRYCPICAEPIAENSRTCSRGHVLSEKIGSRPTQIPHTDQNVKASVDGKGKNYFKKITDKIRPWLRMRKYRRLYTSGVFWAIVIALVVMCFIDGDLMNPSNLPVPNQNVQNTTNNQAPVLENRTLANGTFLAENSNYLRGSNALTVENNGSYDSVVKLITSKSGILAYSVYISANSSDTVNDISDGLYRVIYSTGSDWDGSEFTYNQSYESFPKPLDYNTYGEYDLTLSAATDGNVQPDDIDQSTFDQYR